MSVGEIDESERKMFFLSYKVTYSEGALAFQFSVVFVYVLQKNMGLERGGGNDRSIVD